MTEKNVAQHWKNFHITKFNLKCERQQEIL